MWSSSSIRFFALATPPCLGVLVGNLAIAAVPPTDAEAAAQAAANPKLTAEQSKAVERDYAMTGGVLKIKVRKAMEGYLRDRLGIAMADGKMPVRLLE